MNQLHEPLVTRVRKLRRETTHEAPHVAIRNAMHNREKQVDLNHKSGGTREDFRLI